MKRETQIIILRFSFPLLMINLFINYFYTPWYFIYSVIFSILTIFLSLKCAFLLGNFLKVMFLLTGYNFTIYAAYGVIYASVYAHCTRLILTQQNEIFNFLLKIEAISHLIPVIISIKYLKEVLIISILLQFINILYYPQIPIDEAQHISDDFLFDILKILNPLIDNLRNEYKKILEIKNSKHKTNFYFILKHSFLLFLPFLKNLYLKIFLCFGIFIPFKKFFVCNVFFILAIIFDSPILGFFSAPFISLEFPNTWNSNVLVYFLALKLLILWVFSCVF